MRLAGTPPAIGYSHWAMIVPGLAQPGTGEHQGVTAREGRRRMLAGIQVKRVGFGQ